MGKASENKAAHKAIWDAYRCAIKKRIAEVDWDHPQMANEARIMDELKVVGAHDLHSAALKVSRILGFPGEDWGNKNIIWKMPE
jgi:hypothetical protein